MKAMIASGLCLALGLWATHAGAEELQWRATPATSAAGGSSSGISLRAPQALQGSGASSGDAQVLPASYQPANLASPMPVFRAKPDDFTPRALPVGPSLQIETKGEPIPLETIPSNPTPRQSNGMGVPLNPMPQGSMGPMGPMNPNMVNSMNLRLIAPTQPGTVGSMPPQMMGPMNPGFVGSMPPQMMGPMNPGFVGSMPPYGVGPMNPGFVGSMPPHGPEVYGPYGPSYVDGPGESSSLFGGNTVFPENCGCFNYGSDCGICCAPSCDMCSPCTSCCGLDECCPTRSNHFWASAEMLFFAVQNQRVPPLVTSTPAHALPVQPSDGVLGFPTTTVLLDRSPEDQFRAGARFTAGFWLPCCSDIGFEGSYFFLSRRTGVFTASSNGDPILARPFFNSSVIPQGPYAPPIVINREDAELVAFPGLLTGSVTVRSSSELWGAEANARYKLCCGPCYHLDFLAGYRHLELKESLSITEQLQVNPNAGGASFTVQDSFSTLNRFNGGQLGLDGEVDLWWRFYVAGQMKVALGAMNETVNINGFTTQTLPGGLPVTQIGGLLAQRTNIGRVTKTQFAVIPEVTLKLGVNVTDHLRVFVGYDFLYLSDVVRPGEQIDRVVNITQLPFRSPTNGVLVGPARPTVLFKTTDFWAQGLNFGLEYKY